MKPRHAAALALVGWYLMVPTPYGSSSLRYVENLPLSKWTIFQSFDSADACENGLYAMRKENSAKLKALAKAPPKDTNDASPAERLVFLYGLAQCVEADDPRLKEK